MRPPRHPPCRAAAWRRLKAEGCCAASCASPPLVCRVSLGSAHAWLPGWVVHSALPDDLLHPPDGSPPLHGQWFRSAHAASPLPPMDPLPMCISMSLPAPPAGTRCPFAFVMYGHRRRESEEVLKRRGKRKRCTRGARGCGDLRHVCLVRACVGEACKLRCFSRLQECIACIQPLPPQLVWTAL